MMFAFLRTITLCPSGAKLGPAPKWQAPVFDESMKMARSILKRVPSAVFFGGKLIFPNDSILLRLLHNQIVFAVQKRLYREGIPFVVLPIRMDVERPLKQPS